MKKSDGACEIAQKNSTARLNHNKVMQQMYYMNSL